MFGDKGTQRGPAMFIPEELIAYFTQFLLIIRLFFFTLWFGLRQVNAAVTVVDVLANFLSVLQ